ncbi:MAG: hypothetical protein V1649_04740 [Patescibacteria group bacterium]
MIKNNKTESIIKADLNDLSDKLEKSFDNRLQKLDQSFDVKFDKKFKELDLSFDVKFDVKFDKKFKKLDKSIDVKLCKFAEEVILPAVSNIVSGEIGKHRHEMKNYIDSKLMENKGDIISFIKGDKERDKNWKFKIINILERKKLANPQELKILTNL